MKSLAFAVRAAAVVAALFFAGCTGEEKVINTLPDTWQLLCVSAAAPSALAVQKYPENTAVSADVFQQVNNRQLPAAVTAVVEFRDRLYLLTPAALKIYALDAKTFALKDSMDFTKENRIPTALCFANATTAYVAHEHDSVVSVVDITVFKTARTVATGRKPVGIAAVGNQVFVANQLGNTITQIDTRTNVVTAQHQTPPAPTFIVPSTDGRSIVAVCLGAGKADNSSSKTAAFCVFIDAPTAQITAQTALDDPFYETDIAAKPRGLTTTSSDWAFIPTDMGLFQLDLVNKREPIILNETPYDIAMFNYRRGELLLVEGGSVIVADPNTAKEKARYALPLPAVAILGM